MNRRKKANFQSSTLMPTIFFQFQTPISSSPLKFTPFTEVSHFAPSQLKPHDALLVRHRGKHYEYVLLPLQYIHQARVDRGHVAMATPENDKTCISISEGNENRQFGPPSLIVRVCYQQICLTVSYCMLIRLPVFPCNNLAKRKKLSAKFSRLCHETGEKRNHSNTVSGGFVVAIYVWKLGSAGLEPPTFFRLSNPEH